MKYPNQKKILHIRRKLKFFTFLLTGLLASSASLAILNAQQVIDLLSTKQNAKSPDTVETRGWRFGRVKEKVNNGIIPAEVQANDKEEYHNALKKAQNIAQTMLNQDAQSSQHNEGFNVANLIGGIIFSGIGFVAFVYGKKMSYFKPMAVGLVLMIYPYFISNTIVMYVIGLLLCLALFIFQE